MCKGLCRSQRQSRSWTFQELQINVITEKHSRSDEITNSAFFFPLNLKKLEKELKKAMALLSENKNLNHSDYQNNLFNDQLSRTNDLTVETPDLWHILYTGWPDQEARRGVGRSLAASCSVCTGPAQRNGTTETHSVTQLWQIPTETDSFT